MSGLTYRRLQRACRRLDYRFYDTGEFNLNIIGIRTDDNRSNIFNDWICLAYRQNDGEQLMVFAATTDPGTYWRNFPMNVKGAAIMVPGQYPGAFKRGVHRGSYDALIQNAPVSVYRDNNRDDALDHTTSTIETGMFNINLHRGPKDKAASQVGKWSAGCQVVADPEDFNVLMAIVNRAAEIWGETFTYTLLTETQLWE